jgi:hypothetical protein
MSSAIGRLILHYFPVIEAVSDGGMAVSRKGAKVENDKVGRVDALR